MMKLQPFPNPNPNPEYKRPNDWINNTAYTQAPKFYNLPEPTMPDPRGQFTAQDITHNPYNSMTYRDNPNQFSTLDGGVAQPIQPAPDTTQDPIVAALRARKAAQGSSVP